MVKYLIIRFSSIGDIILTTPVIRCLHEQVEEAEIHYLTKERFAPVLEANPHITTIHTLGDSFSETIKTLKAEGFDYIIDLHHNLRSARVKQEMKRMYFNVNKLNFRKWLLVNWHIDRMPEVHIVDRYLETVRLFDVHNDGTGLDYYIPEKDNLVPQHFPESFRQGYIALVTGAGHATKMLPEERLSGLVGLLDYPVVLVGGPGDREAASRIAGNHPEKPIWNTCGELTINQSASVVQQASCVVSHDTGMMHAAAAFKKKIVTIWGNTDPRFGMAAYQPDPASVDFEITGLSCRPCSKIGYSKCPKKHFRCMLDHDLHAIADAANRLAAS